MASLALAEFKAQVWAKADQQVLYMFGKWQIAYKDPTIKNNVVYCLYPPSLSPN